jgi:hypothetical protein
MYLMIVKVIIPKFLLIGNFKIRYAPQIYFLLDSREAEPPRHVITILLKRTQYRSEASQLHRTGLIALVPVQCYSNLM